MRADPDRQDDCDEVNSSHRAFYDEPRARQSSPTSCHTPTPLVARKSPPPSSTPRADSPAQTSNQTPLLTATLNAPPQNYYQGSTSVRVKQDLQFVASCKKGKSVTCEEQAFPEQAQSSQQSQAVFYSALLKQLRQKAGEPGQQSVQVASLKVKREKAGQKPLPFICPACKKRFQRHIAMNAHFQNEHISAPGPSGERACRLCGQSGSGLAAVRLHLLTQHNIDLDNPAKCLVEDPSKYSVLEASLRSGTSQEEAEPSCSNLDMSGSSRSCSPHLTPSPAHTPTSSESPERSLFPIKPDGCPAQRPYLDEDEEVQVEDLSLRRPTPQSPILRSPRPESPKPTKRPRLRERSPSPAPPQYSCSHCNITYPNQTLYFLHKGFHSESNPWRCNGCGHTASDLYDFNTHLFSVAHQ